MPTSYGTLFGQLLFGFSDERNLRNGVDTVRVSRRVRLHFETDRAGGGQPALLHRHRREGRKSDQVADREDVRHLGMELPVHRDAAAWIGFEAGGGEIEVVDGALAADRVQQRISCDSLVALQ
jgi:hypothetical protein